MAKKVKFPTMLYVKAWPSGLSAETNPAGCLCDDEGSTIAGVYHLDHTVEVKRKIIVTPTPKQAAPKKRKK